MHRPREAGAGRDLARGRAESGGARLPGPPGFGQPPPRLFPPSPAPRQFSPVGVCLPRWRDSEEDLIAVLVLSAFPYGVANCAVGSSSVAGAGLAAGLERLVSDKGKKQNPGLCQQ